MIIAGQVVNGWTQRITDAGERIVSAAKPQKIYIGVTLDMFSAKRLWVDDVLSDAERILFIKKQFAGSAFYSVDYEIIDHDAGRSLLHAYALHERCFKKNVTAVETTLHGLGRALFRLYDYGRLYQCVSIFEKAVVVSVHRDECLYFFATEYFAKQHEAIYAIRRAMEHCYVAHVIDIDQCFFVNFTDDKALDLFGEIDFDAPLTVIDDHSKAWLVAYGLACRGLEND